MADEEGRKRLSQGLRLTGATPSRRGILAGAGGGWAALRLGLVAAGAQAGSSEAAGRSPPLFVHDRSIDGAANFAREASNEGARLASFSGDIGDAWLNVIAPLWRKAAAPVIGLTRGGALFCLEQLAREHRVTCVWRSPLAEAEEAGAAIETLIALSRTALPVRVAPLAARARTFPAVPILWLLQPVAARVTA